MLFHRWRPVVTDGVIDLVPLRLMPPEKELGFGKVLDYMICPAGRHREAGRISIRLGEGRGIYYYGHIGYHIDPPWRGQQWARRACLLAAPMIRKQGITTMVITTDPDNIASRRTCEAMGCTLERTVAVPEDMQRRWDISPRKCRYIWRLTQA